MDELYWYLIANFHVNLSCSYKILSVDSSLILSSFSMVLSISLFFFCFALACSLCLVYYQLYLTIHYLRVADRLVRQVMTYNSKSQRFRILFCSGWTLIDLSGQANPSVSFPLCLFGTHISRNWALRLTDLENCYLLGQLIGVNCHSFFYLLCFSWLDQLFYLVF